MDALHEAQDAVGELAELVALRDLIERQLRVTTVLALRTHTGAQVAAVLGMSRQYLYRKYAKRAGDASPARTKTTRRKGNTRV